VADSVRRRWVRRVALLAAALAVPAAALAGTVTLTSSGPISIPSSVGQATAPNYPSTINVAGAGTVQNVRVTLNNVTLTEPDSADIALQHGATTVMIISDAGDTASTAGANPVFDKGGSDFSASACEPPAVQGQFPQGPAPVKPINCAANTGLPFGQCDTEANPDNFPNPGPGAIPAGTPDLGAFDMLSQQGDWKLWVFTDCDHFGTGSMDSWTLTITNGNPTAVKLVGFDGRRTPAGVTIRWRTADESAALGYNVWRVSAGKTTRLNRSLVAARASGRPTGAAYRFVDRSARRGSAYTYRLQLVTLEGSRYWLGSTSLSATL
jgi:hypothetical protein